MNIFNNYSSFKKNFSWLFFGNSFQNASKILFIMILAKTSSREVIGNFGFAQAVTAPLFGFFHFKLRRLLATDVKREFTLAEFFFLAGILAFIALIICFGIGFFWLKDTAYVIAAMALVKWAEFMGETAYGVIQRNEKMNLICWSRILHGFFYLPLMVLVLWYSGSLPLALFGYFIISLALFFSFDLWCIYFVEPETQFFLGLNFNQLKRLTKLGFPLGVSDMLVSLNSSIPRYLLKIYRSTQELGAFVSISQIALLNVLIQGAIQESSLARMSQYYVISKRKFLLLIIKLCLVGSSISIGVVILFLLFGKILITLIFNESYIIYVSALLVLLIALVFKVMTGLIGAAALTMRLVNYTAIIEGLQAVITLVLGMFFINRYGVIGCSITILLAALVQLFLYSGVVLFNLNNQKMKELINDKKSNQLS